MTKDYLLSYTSAPLMSREMKLIAGLYVELSDWQVVEKHILEDNTLQKPTRATQKRILLELKKRFVHLTDEQIRLLADASVDDAKTIAFISAVKTYRLVLEFVSEVMCEKYFLIDHELQNSDYNAFIESKQAQSDKLRSISEMTYTKLRQVMFNMLHEAGLVEGTRHLVIQRPAISERAIESIVVDDPRLLKLFLLTAEEIDYYIGKYA